MSQLGYRAFAVDVLDVAPRSFLYWQNGSIPVPARIVALMDYWDAHPESAPIAGKPRVTISRPPTFKERRKR